VVSGRNQEEDSIMGIEMQRSKAFSHLGALA